MTKKDWEAFSKQLVGIIDSPNHDTGCHKYKLGDILEKYGFDESGYYGLIEHEYLLVCMRCGLNRRVKEETYYKMMEHGVVYNAD